MKTMGIREFLRGAYKDINEPVMIMSNNRPIGVWTPKDSVADEVSMSLYSTPTAYSSYSGPFSSSTIATTSEWLSGSITPPAFDQAKTFFKKKK